MMQSGIRHKTADDRSRYENDKDQPFLDLIPIYHKKT
jgi:hypothetical protein